MELGRIRNKPAEGVRRTSKRARASGDSFSVHLDHVDDVAESEGGIEPVSPVMPITSLIATQEVDPQEGQDQAGRQWGKELLAMLEELRMAMIHEQVKPSHLERIRRMIESPLGRPADPRLQRLLRDIETRARVELAKYGR